MNFDTRIKIHCIFKRNDQQMAWCFTNPET